MAIFVNLVNLTEQGIKNVKDTTKRAEAFRQMAAKTGVKVKEIYWTIGAYDVITIMEAPDAETVLALLFSIGAQGNVRTHTMRAFSAEEMNKVISKMA